MAQTHFQKRPKQVATTLDLKTPNQPGRSIFANRFASYWEGDWIFMFFSYVGKFSIETEAQGVVMHRSDAKKLAAAVAGYSRVFKDVTPTSLSELEGWQPKSVGVVQAATVIQLAHSSGVYETTFSGVSLHTVIDYARKVKDTPFPQTIPLLVVKSGPLLQFAIFDAMTPVQETTPQEATPQEG